MGDGGGVLIFIDPDSTIVARTTEYNGNQEVRLLPKQTVT